MTVTDDVVAVDLDAGAGAARPVATAAPLPDEPRVSHGSLRWYAAAASAFAVAATCLVLLSSQRIASAPAPGLAPPTSQAVAINRTTQAGGLTVILGYAEKRMKSTWLHVFLVNASDHPQPASLTVHDLAVSGVPAVPVMNAVPAIRDDADRSDLRPIMVPAHTTVHQVVEMAGDVDGASVTVRERLPLEDAILELQIGVP